MADIARLAGVSRNAVSLALRQSPEISPAMREKIAAVAESLGYERNPALGHVMSQMRRRSGPGSMGTIAVFNANQDQQAFRKHPTVPVYLRGATQRASGLGYALDTFWLYEEGVDSRRWLEILESRGVLGVLFIGMMRENRLPEFIVPVGSTVRVESLQMRGGHVHNKVDPRTGGRGMTLVLTGVKKSGSVSVRHPKGKLRDWLS